MQHLLFLKLGGSLITDKAGVEAVRGAVLARVAQEIAAALAASPDLRLVLGHGSGSFGHVAAAAENTRQGVQSAAGWYAFARVSDAAARLNRLVVAALLDAGVPALSLQPSASADCRDGMIRSLASGPVRQALAANLVPVVYGDVAFDDGRGGTIISTEEVLAFLAGELQPQWFLLAGETTGVLDLQGTAVATLTPANLEAILPALGRSRGTDVTGGMASKVREMLVLVSRFPQMKVRVFSGLDAGSVRKALVTPEDALGTVLQQEVGA